MSCGNRLLTCSDHDVDRSLCSHLQPASSVCGVSGSHLCRGRRVLLHKYWYICELLLLHLGWYHYTDQMTELVLLSRMVNDMKIFIHVHVRTKLFMLSLTYITCHKLQVKLWLLSMVKQNNALHRKVSITCTCSCCLHQVTCDTIHTIIKLYQPESRNPTLILT